MRYPVFIENTSVFLKMIPDFHSWKYGGQGAAIFHRSTSGFKFGTYLIPDFGFHMSISILISSHILFQIDFFCNMDFQKCKSKWNSVTKNRQRTFVVVHNSVLKCDWLPDIKSDPYPR